MSAPAGWYDDGSGQQRWWDGGTWGVYAQDVSPVPGGPGVAGYGQVAGAVGQPATSSGMFNALGRAVKNAAQEQRAASKRRRQEREELEQAARRKQEELDRRAGPLATSGVFGDAYIEIFENGYVRVGEALVAEVARRQERLTSISGSQGRSRYSRSLESRMSSQPYEKLLSISFSRGDGLASSPESGHDVVGGAAMKALSAVAKGSLKASVPGLAVAGVGYVAKKVVSGKSVLTIATDRQIHVLSNRAMLSTGGIPLIKTGQGDVGEVLERVGNSVLTVLGRGPAVSNAPALPPGQIEPPQRVSASPVSTVDVTASLRDLAQLHSEGFLDDEEFLEAKRQLLGKL
ncbi:hypothetical protein BKH21_00570 [Actinomyces oris]|nr:hypothetical protein BKH21_00570 [Actinomyces oris]